MKKKFYEKYNKCKRAAINTQMYFTRPSKASKVSLGDLLPLSLKSLTKTIEIKAGKRIGIILLNPSK